MRKYESINKSNKIWRIMCQSRQKERKEWVKKRKKKQMEKINSKKNVSNFFLSCVIRKMAMVFFFAFASPSLLYEMAKCKIFLIRLSQMLLSAFYPWRRKCTVWVWAVCICVRAPSSLSGNFFCHCHQSATNIQSPHIYFC